MKRPLLVAVALVLFAFQASAQFSMGITGGLNFCEARSADVNMSAPVGYHMGMTCNVDLSAGFRKTDIVPPENESGNLDP